MSKAADGDGVRSSRVLVYRPWPAALTENLLYAAAGSTEVHPHVDPSWGEAMERSAI